MRRKEVFFERVGPYAAASSAGFETSFVARSVFIRLYGIEVLIPILALFDLLQESLGLFRPRVNLLPETKEGVRSGVARGLSRVNKA